MINKVRKILEERLAISALDYEVPKSTEHWKYMLGGITAFLIVVIVITGLYIAQFYNPTVQGAHDSVLYIISRAPLGDWVRSLHFFASGALVITLTAHLAYVFWKRSYKKPREITWWAGVLMAAVIFLLVITGTTLRYDQEGFEALLHFVAGGNMTGAFGSFFTEDFTPSTSLLSRIFSLHTSLLPILLAIFIALHFWLIRHLGISADSSQTGLFRNHAIKLTGYALVLFAGLGVLSMLIPEGIGYPAVPGVEITKPFWPVLWIYGLENLLGAWGMILGPSVIFLFLMAVPVLDRNEDATPGQHGWIVWTGIVLSLLILGLWLYGLLGETKEHIM